MIILTKRETSGGEETTKEPLDEVLSSIEPGLFDDVKWARERQCS